MSSDAGSQLSPVHPLVRNVLRLLHEYAIKRSPTVVQGLLPTPSRFDAIVDTRDRYTEATVRASLRVFLVTGLGSKLVDLVSRRSQRGSPKCALFVHGWFPSVISHHTLTCGCQIEADPALLCSCPQTFVSLSRCLSCFFFTALCIASSSDCVPTCERRMPNLFATEIRECRKC
jgi:hypothetical protein